MRAALAHDAPSFQAALAQATTDELIRALFAAVAPFAAMFQDIVAYFKRAGANEGANHWNVAIGREIPELKEFERFLEIWDSTFAEVSAPAIGWAAKRALRRAVNAVIDDYRHDEPTSIDEVDHWYELYTRGQFPPLPLEVAPIQFPAPISDAAMICAITLGLVRARWRSRDELMDAYQQWNPVTRQRTIGFSRDDAFHPGTVAQDETDYWLGNAVKMLAHLRHTDPAIVRTICAKLEPEFEGLQLRVFTFATEAARLQRLLSLPVWKKRNEVYAVWVCTEIVQSLPDHKVALLSEERRLLFAFRKTRLAVIETSLPPLTLYGERRVKLANPLGKKRTGNVQPDYSLWTEGQSETCKLVVEVKHYKEAKQRDFNEVLIDYARAHPSAAVLLVNYGRLGDVPNLGDASITSRCRQIGNLTSGNRDQRNIFRDAVSNAVGPRKWPLLLVVDVSKGMARLLKEDQIFAGWFATTWMKPGFLDERMVVLADHKVRDHRRVLGTSNAIVEYDMSEERDLVSVLQTLGDKAEEFVVVTDKDGLTDLLILPEHTASRLLGYSDIWAVRIHRQALPARTR